VPGKNKASVGGKPLIQYSIDVAVSSRAFADILVSSDDPEIITLAAASHVKAFQRPAELAEDTTPITDVIDHILSSLSNSYDAVMLLQPTAPLREPHHLTEAIKLLSDPTVNSVISVCEMQDVHPARMYTLQAGLLQAFVPAFEQTRRQDIPPAYYRNGSIYLVRVEAFKKMKSVMVKPTAAYIMDRKYLCNIDDPRDLIIAEALVKAWKEGTL